MELRVNLSKIEEMKGEIEELEASLQNYEMRIQFFKANEDRWKEQHHHAQDQIRNRDYLMGEAITQIREVADYFNLETSENQPTTHSYGTRKKSMDKRLEKLEKMQKNMQEQM
ncbi:hypothetical protein PVK06_024671 [Gossypium arboreum]|uniref:Uncharacterized protein n=1 Tax=Gossypium arboreum TaxID=29729 RepID=A0ABR0PEJ2_GOSAR|nr:hypothetical protein PVK06_024671 [Gossypium arboreum]